MAAGASLVDESVIFGREEDKQAIIQLLLSGVEDGKNLAVIAIEGMIGVGKTTLAQLVYFDARVQDFFDESYWINVSKSSGNIVFEVIRYKNVNITWEDYIANPILYQDEFKKKISGRRGPIPNLLLVLDDYIDNYNYFEWVNLLAFLQRFGLGIRIVVTTHNQTVASMVSTVPVYHLKELDYDNCWSLFVKYAFGLQDPNTYPRLQEMEAEVHRYCKGLPLAAKVLGISLRYKRDAADWKYILEHSVEYSVKDYSREVLMSLFDGLPDDLRPCFAICARFSKDHMYTKEELVQLWITEGLVVKTNGNKRMEDTGYEYFSHLVSLSLLQPSSANPSCFIMHYLIHDLAQYVYGKYFQQSTVPNHGITLKVALLVWILILINLSLEILLVIFDQTASTHKPLYALLALVVSFTTLIICVGELIYKGQRRNGRGLVFWLCHPFSNHCPYSFIDAFTLLAAMSQVALSSIAYSYLHRGMQNPIKISIASIICIICFACSILVKRPYEIRFSVTRRDD